MKRKTENGKREMEKTPARFSVFRFPFSVEAGFTLVELVITVVVLSVLALGTIPLVQNAVRRQKEQQLRESLREMRLAIDEFRAEAVGNPKCGGNTGIAPAPDPRSRVIISDCKIFGVDNLDRYPPTLELLVSGVEVTPRNPGTGGKTIGGGAFDNPKGATGDDPDGATGTNNATEPKKKVYLRELPIDPITGKSDWRLRSPYQEKDAGDWDNISVFDVRSTADGETLDGVKYKDL
ncbi:MAG: type II secretion system protein [Pyrinomonadaceae bacterium]